ncbi:MAG: cyclic lactone autoinducer peptide [Sedimentibacter sp.]
MKKSLSILSSFAAFLVVTAQATMGTTCIILVNQPKVPECLLNDDK